MSALRIAWLGPVGEQGGVPAMGTLLLGAVADTGAKVDLFTAEGRAALPAAIGERTDIDVVTEPTRWRYERWYSRQPLAAFASGLAVRALVHRRLTRRLERRHAEHPYDVVFQLSQTELFGLGDGPGSPPVVVHPCSHSAGELRWHRHESAYARRSESTARHLAVRAALTARTGVQRRELRRPAMVVGPSDTFLAELRSDYGVEERRTRVLRHPVDLCRFPAKTEDTDPLEPLRLLFASRIAVRKGVELIVALSHRLQDLAGQVRLDVAGAPDTWSDYRRHLEDLNPAVARVLGPVTPAAMPALLRDAHAVLVPSRYEPGSLVVGEALASGLPVVVSDRVGPAEVLPRNVCRIFAAGDLDAFEVQVRRLAADLRAEGPALSRCAAAQARAHFAPAATGDRLVRLLTEAARPDQGLRQ